VALARALAVAPEILLLDEPLSALDPNFREEIRDLLKSLHRETDITALMVTHDFAEAHFLAARTAVISAGAIEQVGPVAEVFRRPVSPAVAAFVGMKNIFEARLEGGKAKTGALELILPGTVDPGSRFVAVRPEDLEVGFGAGRRAQRLEPLFRPRDAHRPPGRVFRSPGALRRPRPAGHRSHRPAGGTGHRRGRRGLDPGAAGKDSHDVELKIVILGHYWSLFS
jgi:hypothetical protein